jgi:hypothetical protein
MEMRSLRLTRALKRLQMSLKSGEKGSVKVTGMNERRGRENDRGRR